MKKWSLFLAGYLCLCLLAACAGGGELFSEDVPPQCALSEKTPIPKSAEDVITCRVIDGAAEKKLLLAGSEGAVYRLTLEEGIPVEGVIQDGALVEIGFNGLVMETFPAQLGEVSSVTVLQEGFDNRCSIYLQVLADLWSAGGGGPETIGVDLSATGLKAGEQEAVIWAFGEAHGVSAVRETGGIEDLQAQYKAEQDSCLLMIREQVADPSSEGTLSFEAEVMHGSSGGSVFTDCTAAPAFAGGWGSYEVGAVLVYCGAEA